MAQSVNLWGATYSDVPAIEVPKSGGGMASFTDVTDTTAVASDVAQGKYFFTASGQLTLGTASGGGGGYVWQDQDGYIVLPSTGGGSSSATQHTIHLEFSDSTDTDVDVYYDDSLIGAMITAYEPSTWTYSSKTVTLAQLDNVTWYDKQSIPIGVELIDFTTLSANTSIDGDGDAYTEQYYYATDYTAVESGMTFSYLAGTWTRIGVYNSSKVCINVIEVWNDGSGSGNVYSGTLSGAKLPTGSAYVRIASPGNDSTYMSLIRTA